jgi:perosamine synthetase
MTHHLFPLDETLRLPSDQDCSGRTLGQEELMCLADAIRSGTLTGTKGTFVNALQDQFADLLGIRYAYACASGTSAIHTAIAAIDPEPGDEIVTSAITDMGALTPILYQGAIPVFADVDPRTCNLTARTIEPCLSERTKAIIVTHLFGNPCDMGDIMTLAQAHRIPVIEDCAQAFLAQVNGAVVGTIGSIGCFSLQQGKHITTGEGGLVVTHDASLARRMFLFINKAWGYGDDDPDHYFLALNSRMSELQGAVAVAQLPKLSRVVASRIEMATALTQRLQSLAGVETPWVSPGNVHVYWKYGVRIDARVVPGGPAAVAARLKQQGIAAAPRYIQKPAFMCEIFQKQRTFGGSRYPFTLARPQVLDYDRCRFPGTFSALARILVLPWNERYTDEHVDHIATAMHEAITSLTERKVWETQESTLAS